MEALGTMNVTRTRGWISKVLAAALRLPPAGRRVPVCISVSEDRACIRWERSFDGFRLCSTQVVHDKMLVERMRPAAFFFELVTEKNRILYCQRRFTFLGVNVPLAIAPRIAAVVTAGDADVSWHVCVDIFVPRSRPLCRYQGWMRLR